MSIIRIKKEREYVSISNAILQNKALTWEARGVMAYLLSKPDGWECRNYDLVNQGPASDHVIRRVLKELQEAGYIHRYRKSEGRGKIEWITEIYETPELNTALRNGTFSSVENFEIESYDLEKSVDIVSTDSHKELITEKTDLNANPQKSIDELERRQTLNYLADQIATICKIDIKLIVNPRVVEALKSLTVRLFENGITNAEVEKFGEWWYDNDWRGKKGQPPTPLQVGDTWGQFEAFEKEPQVKNHEYKPNLTDAQRARLAELTAQNK